MKLRKAWNTVQAALGLGTALAILILVTPLATGTPKMTGVAPKSTPGSVDSAGALDGQRLRAPADESRAHKAHITDAH